MKRKYRRPEQIKEQMDVSERRVCKVIGQKVSNQIASDQTNSALISGTDAELGRNSGRNMAYYARYYRTEGKGPSTLYAWRGLPTGRWGIRTHDPLIKSQLLCQLS